MGTWLTVGGIVALTVAVGAGVQVTLSGDAELAGWLAVLALAVAAGSYAWGRWIAVLWLGVLLWAVPAIASDLAWASGVWDRSNEYEPLPASMFVLPVGVPFFATAALAGVLVRRATKGLRPPRRASPRG